MKTYSIADARNQLPSVVHDAEGGVVATLTRRGRPVAVIVGIETYERLVRQRTHLWSSIQSFRNAADLTLFESDDPFGDIRDRSEGREVQL